jgi:O-acetyl-ADP-ribose deacetylase (regulator of RNase III)
MLSWAWMQGARCKAYEVWGKLSQGGMSDVWLARHADLALPVIIKTLRPTAHEAFETRYARLLNEARHTARLTSPRVVRVIDVGVYTNPAHPELESLPFLVEEYVDGIDLAEFDRRRRNALHRPLPLWAVSDQLAQAAEGLHAAHQAGVVHCDVKPSNLFGYGHAFVKVGDFGVAVGVAGGDPAHPAGTPLFMAPEQFTGERLDRRADVYALGATAFALRYGAPPYASVLEAVRPDVPLRFPPARSPEEAFFQHVVAKMLARRPDARYPTMMVARQHLRALANATAPRLQPTRIAEHLLEIGDVRVTLELGDITTVETDAVVSSATSEMRMRSGVGDAIRRAGGDAIEDEAMRDGARALGDCIATGAGRLACRGVLHAVGGWNEVSCVGRATHRALLLAEERGYTRIAMPAIATGTGRVSVEACADSMMGALRLHLALGGSRLREVRVVLFDAEKLRRFSDVAKALLFGSEESYRFDDEVDAPLSEGDAEATSAPTLFASARTPGVPTGSATAALRTPTERISGPTPDGGGSSSA